jgi:phospholipid/cholesterol/gamma-HCH transport system substrate-binding protein
MAGKRHGVAELAAGAAVLLAAAGFVAYAAGNTGRSGAAGIRLTAKFDNVGSIGPGGDVKIAGVKVGAVTGSTIDPHTFQATLTFTVQDDIKLPADSSATISTGGLLGGSFVTLTPGGSDKVLTDGQTVGITQSATNLEDLLGKFIFNVGSLAEATQKSLDRQAAPPDAAPK